MTMRSRHFSWFVRPQAPLRTSQDTRTWTGWPALSQAGRNARPATWLATSSVSTESLAAGGIRPASTACSRRPRRRGRQIDDRSEADRVTRSPGASPVPRAVVSTRTPLTPRTAAWSCRWSRSSGHGEPAPSTSSAARSRRAWPVQRRSSAPGTEHPREPRPAAESEWLWE